MLGCTYSGPNNGHQDDMPINCHITFIAQLLIWKGVDGAENLSVRYR